MLRKDRMITLHCECCERYGLSRIASVEIQIEILWTQITTRFAYDLQLNINKNNYWHNKNPIIYILHSEDCLQLLNSLFSAYDNFHMNIHTQESINTRKQSNISENCGSAFTKRLSLHHINKS